MFCRLPQLGPGWPGKVLDLTKSATHRLAACRCCKGGRARLHAIRPGHAGVHGSRSGPRSCSRRHGLLNRLARLPRTSLSHDENIAQP
eukprot:593357-Pleurochrysis_carterae.AAC.2